jgi:hypothetical protein
VGKNSPSEFHDCFLCFQTLVRSCTVVLKQDFSKIIVKPNPPKMILQGFKTLNVQIWVNGLNTHGITSTKITPSAFQKISGHEFPC